MIDVRAPSMYGNASSGTFTNTSSGATPIAQPEEVFVMMDLPLWASPEQQRAQHKRSKETFELSPADKARLGSHGF